MKKFIIKEWQDKNLKEAPSRKKIKSNILDKWSNSKAAQEDLETFLEMLYMGGNDDTIEDMRQMFGYLSSVANNYYKKMRLK